MNTHPSNRVSTAIRINDAWASALTPAAAELVNFILGLTADELEGLDERLAGWGIATELTDGSCGWDTLRAMIEE